MAEFIPEIVEEIPLLHHPPLAKQIANYPAGKKIRATFGETVIVGSVPRTTPTGAGTCIYVEVAGRPRTMAWFMLDVEDGWKFEVTE